MNLVINDQAVQGIGCSVARGVEALDESQIARVAIFLGDLPFLKVDAVSKVIDAFVTNGSNEIVRPSCSGQPGHPVDFKPPT